MYYNAFIRADARAEAGQRHLKWDGNNSYFVLRCLLPVMGLPSDVERVVRWAYGDNGSLGSFEGESDGSSGVQDRFMGGIIKEPYGVGHDMLFILHHLRLRTPDGHRWTLREANDWYQRAMEAFGYPTLSKVRRAGLLVGSWPVWILGGHEYKRHPEEAIHRIRAFGSK